LGRPQRVKNKSEIILSEIINSFDYFFSKPTKNKLDFSIALSGGIDSIVLLHALNQLKTQLKLKISAIHVHHDLSPNADDWLSFCHSECKKLSIPIKSEKINIKQDLSMGIEAAARKNRYQVLEAYRKGILVLGHHQNDQSETLLLQLFRGSGLNGLAAMPTFDQERFIWRPLLKINREVIEGFAKENNLNFIEDESNNNLQFDRNFLRKEILPLIKSRYPDIINTISRSSENIAEGLNLHKAIAKEDANLYFSKNKERLSLSMIKVLEKERVVNLIRWWLDVNKQMMPSKKTMSELYKQIKNVKKDALLNIDISDSMSIKAYRDELFLVEKTIKIDPYELIWRGEEVVELPGNSRLIFTKSLGAGFSLTKIGSKTLTIQNRNGGERFKPKNNQPTRTLKYLLQTSDIPPWKRKLMPLVFSENELVAVPDFGVHYKFQTDKEEHGWDIDWINNED
jgi:tRNA(Ile)-lysidine synthase